MVNLFEYIDLVKSGVDKFQGTKKYISTGSLETEGIKDFEIVNYDSKPSRANMQFKENDIIFAKMKDTEKVFLIDKYAAEHIFSTGFVGLRINDSSKFIPKYIYYWIRSDYFQNLKNQNCSGATQKAINNSKLKSFLIPICDISLQKRVVEKLENVEKLIEYRKESIKLLDLYIKNVFYNMFGDPINNTKNWDMKNMSDFGLIQTGNTPSRKDIDNYGNYIEWIKSDNINTPSTFLTESQEYLSEVGYKKGRIVPEGSILVTCIAGSISCLGNVAVANREVAFNQQINSITPNENTNTLFLYYLILNTKVYLQSFSKSALKGMINKKTFSEIPMIHPPVTLQNHFAEIALQVEEIKNNQLESKNELENLFNYLMQKAFKEEFIC